MSLELKLALREPVNPCQRETCAIPSYNNIQYLKQYRLTYNDIGYYRMYILHSYSNTIKMREKYCV